MILLCDRDVTVHAHHARERVCTALAYALYERLAAEGDTCAALLAMGELYAVLTLPLRHASLSARGAVEILTAYRDPDRSASEHPSDQADDRDTGSGAGGGPDADRGAALDADLDRPFPDELLLAAANRVGCAIAGRGRQNLDRHDEIDDIITLFEDRTLDPRLGTLLD